MLVQVRVLFLVPFLYCMTFPGENDNASASIFLLSAFHGEKLVEEVQAARQQMGRGGPVLAFVFVSVEWAPHLSELLEILRREGGVDNVVGCSGGGLIGIGQEIEQAPGCTMLLLRLPGTRLRRAEITSGDLEDVAKGAPLDMITGVSREDFSGWVTVANPMRLPTDLWLAAWNRDYSGLPLYGGLASSHGSEDPFLFTEEGRIDAAMLAVHFADGVRLGGVVSQGCRPIGEPYIVTRVNQNMLVTIGQRSAYEVLEEAFDSLELADQFGAKGNIFAGLAISEYKDEFRRGDFLVRNILGGDPQAGVLAVGAFPRVGQTLQFQLRDRNAADEDLRLQCAAAQNRYGQPFAGLLFSCLGRGRNLFGDPHHDTAVVEDVFGRIPLSGFFCSGEIGPVGGQNFLHGYTAATVFFMHG